MLASAFGTVLGMMVVFALLGLAAAATAALLVGRSLRRRWRLVRSHGLVIGALAVWDATAAFHARRRPVTTAGDLAWSSPRQVKAQPVAGRRRCWRRGTDGE